MCDLTPHTIWGSVQIEGGVIQNFATGKVTIS